MLNFLYKNKIGRIVLKPLVSKPFSSLGGFFMSISLSKVFIKGFIRRNNIDTSEYIMDGINSFNDFFTRRIKDGRRPINTEDSVLISPCDGKLSVYEITDGLVLPVKQSSFTMDRLLMDDTLAKEYSGGLCLVFRLTVDDYHRYSYVETGTKTVNVHIPGKYHTVRPVALEEVPVFIENTREFTIIKTPKGNILQMEVGAMLVGKIENNEKGPASVMRGQEKGRFLFGGSTIIVLLEPNRATIDDAILNASSQGVETPVKLGARIGEYI